MLSIQELADIFNANKVVLLQAAKGPHHDIVAANGQRIGNDTGRFHSNLMHHGLTADHNCTVSAFQTVADVVEDTNRFESVHEGARTLDGRPGSETFVHDAAFVVDLNDVVLTRLALPHPPDSISGMYACEHTRLKPVSCHVNCDVLQREEKEEGREGGVKEEKERGKGKEERKEHRVLFTL